MPGAHALLTVPVTNLCVPNTVEPPNKGHFGSRAFVLYSEAVLWWEVRITIVSTIVISIGDIASVLYIEVVRW